MSLCMMWYIVVQVVGNDVPAGKISNCLKASNIITERTIPFVGGCKKCAVNMSYNMAPLGS